jgi:hypothetical protein
MQRMILSALQNSLVGWAAIVGTCCFTSPRHQGYWDLIAVPRSRRLGLVAGRVCSCCIGSRPPRLKTMELMQQSC